MHNIFVKAMLTGAGSAGWVASVTVVPEPASYAMMLSGLALAGGIARRRRRQLQSLR